MSQMPTILLILFVLPLIPLLVYLTGQRKLASMAAIAGAFFELALAALIIGNYWHQEAVFAYPVLSIRGTAFLEFGFWLNNNSLALLLTVVLISLLIRIYANAYLKNDSRRHWFIVLIGFFTFAMNGIVLMPNLLSLFFFWEWVGLASYLMIGFWYIKPEAAQAARKAFLYNKIGDLGFILALGMVYAHFGTFNIPEILSAGKSISGNLSLWFGFGIFIAAIAKSAQLPFSVWLPDAMEGPTPASALIHSATMVTAGVYVLLRVFPLLPSLVLDVALYIGLITVLWAGLTALFNFQLKKILAYSTISQLGFMMMGIGALAPQSAFFHLITHAYFKTALFLCAGVIISVQAGMLKERAEDADSQDIRRMKGLWQRIPLMGIFLVISGFALAGVPFFSGFISKEAIITALEGSPLIMILALIGALLTALYSGRMVFSVFQFESAAHLINSIKREFSGNEALYTPVLILSLLSFGFVFSSWWPDFSNSWFLKSLPGIVPQSESHLILTAVSVMIALGGLAFAYMRSKNGKEWLPGSVLIKDGMAIDASLNKFSKAMLAGSTASVRWIEVRVIERFITFLTYAFVFMAMIARLLDQYLVDGFVRGVVFLAARVGDMTRNFQSGNLRTYLFWLILFLLLGVYIISHI